MAKHLDLHQVSFLSDNQQLVNFLNNANPDEPPTGESNITPKPSSTYPMKLLIEFIGSKGIRTVLLIL